MKQPPITAKPLLINIAGIITGFYFDYDYVAREQKESLTLAAAYPLFFGMASKEQAARVAKILEENF